MPTANVIQLRQLLAEKFPNLRTQAEGLGHRNRAVWATGLAQIDGATAGGLPRGALTEIIAARRGSGSALLVQALLRHAARENQIAALVDGRDSCDVTQLESRVLARLLWVRCRTSDEALKAADLVLRDGNLPLVLVDLAVNPAAELRRIPATTWYRFQRIVEQTPLVCAVLTPRAMVAPAQMRITLLSRFSADALERDPEELAQELKVEISEVRRANDLERARAHA